MLIKLLIFLIVVSFGLVAFVRYMEATSVFYPTREILATPRDAGLAFDEITFPTTDRLTLHGWWVPDQPKRASPATLIFLHGNAGNIGDRVDKITLFTRLGMNVFIFDYRGYGTSEGKPTEQGMYQDALAAYDFLKASRPEAAKGKILIYGASLGGAAAVDLASRRDVDAVILDSTFSTAADMGKVIMPVVPSFLLNIKLDSVSKIQNVSAPKLFFHSPDDEVVPFRLGKKLFEAAPGPKQFVTMQGTHNDGHLFSTAIFVNGIREFLATNQILQD